MRMGLILFVSAILFAHSASAVNLLKCNKLICPGCFFGTHDIHTMSSSSMFPTLNKGDCITVQLIDGNEADYGDVVTFRFNDQIYIFRIMAKSGDKIQVRKGKVFLNEKPLFARDVGKLTINGRQKFQQEEISASGKHYFTVNARQSGMGDNTNAFKVPDGHVFVMGDNRDNANDSRFEVKFLPVSNIRGRLDETK